VTALPLPRSLARFNKKVTNRIQGLWAPWLPPWAVIIHKGRKSGRSYQTPVLAFRSGPHLAVILFYGERAEWLRNVLAAGSAEVRRAGRLATLTNPRVLNGNDPALAPSVRRIARRLRVLLTDFTE
jgi:deazaflavin-dependent oxidoreductase (nitroreductase family)